MYYPKSQIKPNLYTNGNELVLSTDKTVYVGYYYEISTGQKYTGKTPQDGPSILLIPPPNSPTYDPTNREGESNFNSLIQYTNLSPLQYPSVLPSRTIPTFNLTTPTQQDYQNTQFNRYFCKKNNELRYLEINKDTYQKLQARDPKIAWDLYTPTIVLWQLKGNKEQVYNSNKGTIISIEQNLKWTGFTQYFQDKFLKYYLES
jgi:hypothetical protein